MKLKLVMAFSVIIALLSLTAIADRDVQEFDLKFKGAGYFVAVPNGDDLVFSPAGGFETLKISHLGKSQVAWELRVDPNTFEFRSGTFTITGANGRDGLKGYYSSFELNFESGEYDLDWVFTGGAGRFENATGQGHSDGLSDLETLYAKFQFSGVVTVPK